MYVIVRCLFFSVKKLLFRPRYNDQCCSFLEWTMSTLKCCFTPYLLICTHNLQWQMTQAYFLNQQRQLLYLSNHHSLHSHWQLSLLLLLRHNSFKKLILWLLYIYKQIIYKIDTVSIFDQELSPNIGLVLSVLS